MLKDIKLTEGCFQYGANEAHSANYGELFCPMFGYDVVELTEENIQALREGKVLITCINTEYTALIRMKKEEPHD
jgi:hypothetical protein